MDADNDSANKLSLWNNNTFKIVLITVLISILVILAIVGIKRLRPSDNDIRAMVSPRSIRLNDSVFYKDSSLFSTDRRWNFDDGSQAYTAKGFHKYSSPGNYTVILNVNSRYQDTFLVTVKDTIHRKLIQDSVISIDGPLSGMQFENLVFRVRGGAAAKEYRWQFGETNYTDAKESFVQYFYKKPGTYTVKLITDVSQYPVYHKIVILPAYEQHTDSLMDIEDMYKKYEDDFKTHLQEIARGKNFNTNYYYLVHRYLCNNEKAAIKINGAKVNDFNSYCLGLQFDNGMMIQSVKLTPTADMNCMKSVEIKQDKIP